MGMPRSDYDEITSVSQDGTGEHKNLKQSFLVPSRLHEASSSSSKRTVNIMLAWISDDWVWALVDVERLARFYIISRDIPWSSVDIKPESAVSNSVYPYHNLRNNISRCGPHYGPALSLVPTGITKQIRLLN